MSNENEEVGVEEVEDIVEEKDDEGNDTTDYKALALKMQGMAKRFQTKIKKLAETPPAKPTVETKSEGLDYGQKAYLVALGYKDPAEQRKIEEAMKSTGKRIEDVLENPYLKSDIENMREINKSQVASDATSKSKRTGTSSKSEVDYWVAKGELPEDVVLARQVVAARRFKDSKGNPFRK